MDAIKELLEHGCRVARRMSNDPEMESEANEAVFRAVRSYSPEYGMLPKAYVTMCVKRNVWDVWRKRAKEKAKLKSSEWWLHVEAEVLPDTELPIPQERWRMLVEHYIDKYTIGCMAHKRGISKSAMVKRIKAAVAQFVNALKENK
jgi:DNA-directed RNA polymerase specialized sigma24 family protein